MRGAWVVIVGCGNIGSHLGVLIARLGGVRRITLVDRDVYERKNLASQLITRADVGRAKATVQMQRLRAINGRIAVRGIVAAVEDVPLGRLRGDVILACVDSRLARRRIGCIGWRLGIPMIDAGVAVDGLLARVNVYRPGPDAPCIECAWDDADYATQEVPRPCDEEAAVAPTNAPAALGALAAALQAIECRKVLAGQWDQALVGRQATIAAATHQHHVTSFRRNPHCRFDHVTWAIETLEAGCDDLTLADAFLLGGDVPDSAPEHRLRVEGQMFVRKLTCPACGTSLEIPLQLLGRLPRRLRTCACGATMRAAGTDTVEWLGRQAISRVERETLLANLGVLAGDVLSVGTPDRITRHQIGVGR